MMKALVLGGISWDTLIYLHSFPEPRPATIFSTGTYETVGSTGAGKALPLDKLGFAVTLHGFIGDDQPGQNIRNFFSDTGITAPFEIDPAGTERHTNLMAADGGRISIYTHSATFEPPFNAQGLEQQIRASDFVVMNIINYCRHLIPACKAAGKSIWCDIHDYDGENAYHQDFIDAADIIFMSSAAMPDYRLFMQQLITQGKQLVICTHGADGASALTRDGTWYEQPVTSDFTLVDSNGAGDSFFAGFLYGHIQGYSVQKCLQMATLCAGLTITTKNLVHPDLNPDHLETLHRRLFGDQL